MAAKSSIVAAQNAARDSQSLWVASNLKASSQERILRRSSEFNELRQSGKRFSAAPWLTVQYKENNLGYLRYGFSISTKIGSAVVRNRLRRWLREYIRNGPCQQNEPSLDIHVVFRPSTREFYAKLEHSKLDSCFGRFFSYLQRPR